jgi:TolB protein
MSQPGFNARSNFALQLMRRLVLFLLAIMLMLASLAAWPVFSARLQPQLAAASVPSTTPTPTSLPTATQTVAPVAMVVKAPGTASLLESGLMIVSMSDGGYSNLYAFRPGEANAFLRLTCGAWQDITPSFSPDGTRLAFASNRDGQWDLYTLDLSSGKTSRLTDTPAYEASPSWSPDGRWLAYEAYQEGDTANLDIFILPLDGSQAPIQLTDDPAADFAPAWSPQGRQIAFVSTRGGNRDIWLADLNNVGFRDISRTPGAAEDHPAWSPDGKKLSWGSRSVEGVQCVNVWSVSDPADEQPAIPRCIGSGDWPAWDPSGLALLAGLSTPNKYYLTSFDSQQGDLILPPLALNGPVEGLAWSNASLNVTAFQELLPFTATPLWLPALSGEGPLPSGRQRVMPLKGVQAPQAMLQDMVDEAFQALRERLAKETGWDFLSTLENAYVPLTSPLDPGMGDDWLYTGRAFAFNTLPMNATWVVVAPESFGAQTYWRVYVKTRYQDGSQGSPLHEQPWNFNARYGGDPHLYEQGGAPLDAVPPGYWLDFTRLAEAYGWERLPALNTWQSSYPAARFNEFAFTDQLDWRSAMLEIYPAEALVTPTAVTPTAEPTKTPRPPSPTSTPTRTPWRLSSPIPSPTP